MNEKEKFFKVTVVGDDVISNHEKKHIVNTGYHGFGMYFGEFFKIRSESFPCTVGELIEILSQFNSGDYVQFDGDKPEDSYDWDTRGFSVYHVEPCTDDENTKIFNDENEIKMKRQQQDAQKEKELYEALKKKWDNPK